MCSDVRLTDGGHMGTWGVVLMKNLKAFSCSISLRAGDQSVIKTASIYCVLYPSLSESMDSDDLVLPRIYRRMNNITITGQKINSGQYVHAKPAFPDETAPEKAVLYLLILHCMQLKYNTSQCIPSK